MFGTYCCCDIPTIQTLVLAHVLGLVLAVDLFVFELPGNARPNALAVDEKGRIARFKRLSQTSIRREAEIPIESTIPD